MRRLPTSIAVALLLQLPVSAPAHEPAALSGAQTATPISWTLEKRRLSVDMMLKSDGGMKLILSCIRTPNGALAKQLFLADIKPAGRGAIAKLQLRVDGRAIAVETDGVDNGLVLSDSLTDGITTISEQTFQSIMAATQIIVSFSASQKRGSAAFSATGGRSLETRFAAACRAVKS